MSEMRVYAMCAALRESEEPITLRGLIVAAAIGLFLIGMGLLLPSGSPLDWLAVPGLS